MGFGEESGRDTRAFWDYTFKNGLGYILGLHGGWRSGCMIRTKGNRWRSVNLHCSGIAQIGRQEHRIAFTHLDCPKDFYPEEAAPSFTTYLHYEPSPRCTGEAWPR
jgi:hypothetical protein